MGWNALSAVSFYDSRAWRKTRREVMRKYNNECQVCKERHIHKRAELVHHIYHLEDYPHLGLMEFVHDPVTGERQRNLLPVCRECHETVCHPGRMRRAEYKPPLTPERW